MSKTYIYELGGKIYFNITNHCDNDCEFCLRNTSNGVGEHDLWLDYQPTVAELLTTLKATDLSEYTEGVFCGYGEPTQHLDGLISMSEYLKENYPNMPLRINTNGLVNLSYGEDITPRLKGLIDSVSISLNATNATDYQRVCRSIYGEKAFDGLLDFAKKAGEQGIKVVMTIVDMLSNEDVARCREIAQSVGAMLRIRPYLD